jgi:hypothetical protein
MLYSQRHARLLACIELREMIGSSAVSLVVCFVRLAVSVCVREMSRADAGKST